MPANTSNGYPYPLGTDRVMDGDDSIKALAEAADDKAGISAGGKAACPAPPALNTATNVSVTFPAGRFSAPPCVVCTGDATNPMVIEVSGANVTASGFVAYGARITGTLAVINLYWQARVIG
jgi:hypothetical protein